MLHHVFYGGFIMVNHIFSPIVFIYIKDFTYLVFPILRFQFSTF